MSTQAEERRPASSSPSRGGKGLEKKIGPLPVWGWGLLAGGAVIAFILYRRYAAAQEAAAKKKGGGGGTVVAGGIDYGPSIATLQSEIQDLQGRKSEKGEKEPKCPGDMYWDPDADDGKGKCVPEPKPKPKPPPRKREPKGDK